jgi:hypothetical protein
MTGAGRAPALQVGGLICEPVVAAAGRAMVAELRGHVGRGIARAAAAFLLPLLLGLYVQLAVTVGITNSHQQHTLFCQQSADQSTRWRCVQKRAAACRPAPGGSMYTKFSYEVCSGSHSWTAAESPVRLPCVCERCPDLGSGA